MSEEGSLEINEEEQEADPMQVLDNRLTMLEAWLHEDPLQEDLNEKRNEYMCLMDEIELLERKIRRVDRALNQPNRPNIAKLQRKRNQYEREIADIVMYAEQDPFFQLDGDDREMAMNAYLAANSLLGQPLETFAELTGFEESKAWDGVDFDASARTSSVHRRKSVALDHSSGSLDMTKPHNATILNVKLKKAKQALLNCDDEEERKAIFAKIQDYQRALDETSPREDEESSIDKSENSEGSIEVPSESPVKSVSRTMKMAATEEREEY